MALQELARQPQVTGLGDLGSVLLDTSRAYAATKRQDQLLAQHRAQQLQDVTERRGQQLQDVAAQRSYQLQDVATRRSQQLEDVQAAQARSEANYGRVRADQLTDVQGARAHEGTIYERNRTDKMDDEIRRMMQEFASTLVGQGLLLPDQIGDPAALKAAAEQFAARGNEQRVNAVAFVTELQKQVTDIQARMSAPARQFSGTEREVLQLASQLAEQIKPGTGRNREAIAAQVPGALEKLNAEALIRHKLQNDADQVTLAQVRATQREAIQTWKVAPPPAALQPVGSPTSAVKPAQPVDIANALNALLGGGAKPAPSGSPGLSGPAMLANPTGNPTISAGNEELVQRQALQAKASLNNIDREIASVDAALTSAPGSRTASLGMGLGGYSVTSVPNPIADAQRATTLLKQKAGLEQRRRELQEQLQGPVPAGVTAPAVNTSTSSTPRVPFASTSMDWWMGNKPAR